MLRPRIWVLVLSIVAIALCEITVDYIPTEHVFGKGWITFQVSPDQYTVFGLEISSKVAARIDIEAVGGPLIAAGMAYVVPLPGIDGDTIDRLDLAAGDSHSFTFSPKTFNGPLINTTGYVAVSTPGPGPVSVKVFMDQVIVDTVTFSTTGAQELHVNIGDGAASTHAGYFGVVLDDSCYHSRLRRATLLVEGPDADEFVDDAVITDYDDTLADAYPLMDNPFLKDLWPCTTALFGRVDGHSGEAMPVNASVEFIQPTQVVRLTGNDEAVLDFRRYEEFWVQLSTPYPEDTIEAPPARLFTSHATLAVSDIESPFSLEYEVLPCSMDLLGRCRDALPFAWGDLKPISGTRTVIPFQGQSWTSMPLSSGSTWIRFIRRDRFAGGNATVTARYHPCPRGSAGRHCEIPIDDVGLGDAGWHTVRAPSAGHYNASGIATTILRVPFISPARPTLEVEITVDTDNFKPNDHMVVALGRVPFNVPYSGIESHQFNTISFFPRGRVQKLQILPHDFIYGAGELYVTIFPPAPSRVAINVTYVIDCNGNGTPDPQTGGCRCMTPYDPRHNCKTAILDLPTLSTNGSATVNVGAGDVASIMLTTPYRHPVNLKVTTPPDAAPEGSVTAYLRRPTIGQPLSFGQIVGHFSESASWSVGFLLPFPQAGHGPTGGPTEVYELVLENLSPSPVIFTLGPLLPPPAGTPTPPAWPRIIAIIGLIAVGGGGAAAVCLASAVGLGLLGLSARPIFKSRPRDVTRDLDDIDVQAPLLPING